jgi:holo-[acyl-carrier protein] synthase
VPPEHRALIHLTITDEFPMAQAFVIIEAVPYR